MQKTKNKLILGIILLTALPAFGGGAKRGWTKLELTRPGGVPQELVSALGAELVVRHDDTVVVAAPAGRVKAIVAEAANAGVVVRLRDEFDILRLPNAVVDVRNGVTDAPQEKLIRSYRPGKAGLFLLQFSAPPRPEWIAEVQAQGWNLARYVPSNAFIAVGVPELAAQTRKLAYIQWVDFYHPYQKYAHLVRDGAARDVLFELPSVPAAEESIEAIRAAAGTIRVHRGAVDTYVYATLAHGPIEKLLHQQLIIAVSPKPVAALSDERQAMSLTSQVNSTQSAPTNPTDYWSWVTSRCPNCSTMPSSTWKVGLADTGLDNGAQNNGHPDLAGRKYFGANFSTSTSCADNGFPAGCGWDPHGTFVAGIIAGNAGTGYTDADGYYLGQGVAPLAGVFSTRFHGSGATQPQNMLQLTNDAASNSVTVQNHSFNEYGTTPDTSGTYSALSRSYDFAVRDANADPADGQAPIFISVSAGNTFSGSQSGNGKYLVIPGGTAKNVLSVSGSESSRAVDRNDPDYVGWPGCDEANGDSYQNIMGPSRLGTLTTGYIKPDVVAPASAIVSAHTSVRNQNQMAYCFRDFDGYVEYAHRSGTSFAAPVGSGAAIIVKRYLGSAPGDTSPALTKAMIIAGARSIRGGEDRTHSPATTISAVPSTQQGFGRISFDDILTGSTPPVTFDQSSTRTFTTAGQSQMARLSVRDGSKPVKLVLVWSDAPATTGNLTSLVNDLDLEVGQPGVSTSVYLGNKLAVNSSSNSEESIAYPLNQPLSPDTVNNVEYVRFFASTDAEFDVRVKAAQIMGDVNGSSTSFEQDFAFVAVNADLVTTFQQTVAAPTGVAAAATGTTVTISWSAVSNATGYKIERKTSSAGWVTAATVGVQVSTTDAPGATDGVVLYRVRALNGSVESLPSNVDVAYAKAFTNQPIETGPTNHTGIKAAHIVELRKAVNALRAISGLAAVYSGNDILDAAVQDDPIDDAHFTSLLTELNTARQAAGLGTVTFGTAPAVNGAIRGAQLEELRDGVR